MPKALLLPGLLLASFAVSAQTAASPGANGDLTARVTQQNALFEAFYQNNLRNHPEQATSVGDLRYNAQLGDVSLAAIAREHAEADDFLRQLQAISPEGMTESDGLSHAMLVRQLKTGDESYALKNYEMPVNQQNGMHTALADLPLAVPLDSVAHYEDYIARLRQIPRVLSETVEVMRAGRGGSVDAAPVHSGEDSRAVRGHRRGRSVFVAAQEIPCLVHGGR